MSHDEVSAIQRYLDDNLSKGLSLAGSPVLFVIKFDRSLRLCVDYWGLNDGTLKNRYPLRLIQEILVRLQKGKYVTRLNIQGAYNLVRMTEGEQWKTAFRTRYSLFEYNVMPFGLTNAPEDFQRYINDTLHPVLDVFATAYLDSI
jgi:hypothetical protein